MIIQGEFCKKNGIIFRRNTKIIFNNSNKCNGTILMANPGSAKAENEDVINEKWTYFNIKKEDSTMKIIKEILEKAEINSGYIKIINLANKRDANIKNLKIDDLNGYEEIKKEIPEDSSWFWIATGKQGQKIGSAIIKKIEEAGFKNFLYLKERDYYLHPRRIQILGIKEELVKQIKSLNL